MQYRRLVCHGSSVSIVNPVCSHSNRRYIHVPTFRRAWISPSLCKSASLELALLSALLKRGPPSSISYMSSFFSSRSPLLRLFRRVLRAACASPSRLNSFPILDLPGSCLPNSLSASSSAVKVSWSCFRTSSDVLGATLSLYSFSDSESLAASTLSYLGKDIILQQVGTQSQCHGCF